MSTVNFSKFSKLIATTFQTLSANSNIFVADTNDLYAIYLAAFPAGTDLIFKKTTEHDCSCCRNFIRRVGNLIAIKSGKIYTIWEDAAKADLGFYSVVAQAMHEAVINAAPKDLFRISNKESQFGAKQTRYLDRETQKSLTFDHFYTGEINSKFRVEMPDTVRGDYRTTVQVFERGLIELKIDAVNTALSLINSNSLYRGEEHKKSVQKFQELQNKFHSLNLREQRLFVWENANNPVARFRNTVIGTFVQDLSESQDIEYAVRSFEAKVAPQNYKRTTAIITPGMVKSAMQTIEQLGLEAALERRFATISDISVNDVKWVDSSVKSLMKSNMHDMLMQHANSYSTAPSNDVGRAENITLNEFMNRILPEVTGIEILLTNAHVSNLMSLTAPVHQEPKQLFRWSNDFAWSYTGNITDSIKDRVKKAGGNIVGTLRVSLSWFNYDDLDLHIMQPNKSRSIRLDNTINFQNKYGWTGGRLDVDMNAGRGTTRKPVENVIWTDKVPDGMYKVIVNNYCCRESSDPGFTIEIENADKITHYSYNKKVNKQIEVCTLHMKQGVIEHIDSSDVVTVSTFSQEKWGLKTDQYVKVNSIMLSPNYWGDNSVGNKHTFFILDGAKNDEDTRGFYNEFLHPRLESHRKVFEVIADKIKCRPTENQLSGLGFSSTKKESFTIRVQQGKKRRLFNVSVV